MFYVINKHTGEEMHAEGFWAISQSGGLYDVIDGWGCEGGGGSSNAPSHALAVFGEAPSDTAFRKEQEEAKELHRCACGKKFKTETGLKDHRKGTGHV